MRLRATLELSADALTPGGVGVSTIARDAVIPQKTRKLQADAGIVHPDFPTSRNKTVCVDFDNVLNDSSGPYNRGHFGPPISEGLKLLRLLKDYGYNPVIFTARKETDAVAEWLKRRGFPNMLVTNHKIPARLYIDDRAWSWGKTSKANEVMKYLGNPDHVLRMKTE